MASWSQRVQAVKNLPSALKILWDAGPGLVSGALFFRLFAAILPVVMLAVSRKIIEGVTPVVRGEPIAPRLWYWVAFEFSLAITGALVGRAIGFFDSLLSDQFSRHLSVQIMRHASRLDLQTYESPAFQDKLDRARVQATDRVGLITATGSL